MLQSAGQTAVIDTADWALIVPIRPPLNLTGSRLKATLAPARGGPPACVIDSADGSISWVADDAGGLSDYLIIQAAKSLRGSWQATLPTSVFFDVHRTVAGSTADEWLGRTNVLVLPGSDSSIVTQPQASGFVLIPGQPCTGVLLPALQTGPQGPPGPSVPLPVFDPVADEGKSFCLRVVGGALMWALLASASLGLIGASVSTSVARGSLSGVASLSGASVSQSGSAASLTVQRRFAGGAVSTSSVSGTLAALSLPFAASVSASQASGDLTVSHQLQGATQTGANIAGDLLVSHALAGASLSFSQSAGTLAVQGALIGASTAASAASGSVTVQRQLQGSVASAALVAGSLTAQRMLAGSVASNSVASGVLSSGGGTVRPATTGLFADGDSITRGYPLSDPSTQTWEAQFSQQTGLPFYNGGVDGAKLVDIDTNWASDGNAARYNAASLNTYAQEAGTNDIRSGTASDTLISAIQSVMAKARAAGFITYVCTVMNDDQTGYALTQKQTYNAWLRNNYTTIADGIIDFQAAPELQDPNDTTYFVDKLHPTVAGQAVMARVAVQALTGGATSRLLSGSAVAASTAQGTLTVSHALQGLATATATATGSLTAGYGLSGTSVGISSATGTLSTAAAVASARWSATDKDPGVTVTSPTRVDKPSTTSTNYPSIRATVARSTTRRYLEFTPNVITSNTSIIAGIADAAASLSTYLGVDNHSFAFWSNGAIIKNNSFPDYGIGNWAVGDVIGVDWDPAAKTIRARRNNGAWGAAIDISALTPPFYPAVSFTPTVPAAVTVNFGDTAFAYTPPSGAVSWNT